MDNRITIIKDLVRQACERLKADGLTVDSNAVELFVKRISSGNSSIEQVSREVTQFENGVRRSYAILDEGLDSARNLQNLSVQHKGITLNMQDIDLMSIACSNDFAELQRVMENITNISLPPILENEDFVQYRQRVFDSYLSSLATKEDYIRNNDIDIERKIDYLISSGAVDKETTDFIVGLRAEGKSTGEIFSELTKKYDKEKIHSILVTLRDFAPVEKSGIIGSKLEDFQELYRQVTYFYDSITIDEEGKYGRVILQDGTFEDKHLRKALDFARSMGKQVRINTLMFYMDCPKEIYNIDSDRGKLIATEKLTYYVTETAKVLSEYSDVVRSVDVFNELLNRHPVAGDVPYMLRSDFPQDAESKDFDNIKSGWLKHLSVEEICNIIGSAREHLPTMDFMYNDDFLTDPRKLTATIELVQRIQDYGRVNGVRLIDSIGTQMHIDNNISKEEIRNMFLELSKLGLPIEITEFDLAMTHDVDGLSPEQIEFLRQKKINEIFEVVEELREECNIRGFTIWSKTDSQNFRVTLANEIAHRDGKEFISTLHGGYFTEGMIPKSSEMAKLVRKQNFNYHGHTSRCGHASPLPDELYVIAARNQGLDRIGFSDHVAFSTLENWQQGKRMHESEIDGYIASIRKLQEDNPDMKIRCGFEAEYDPSKKGYLAELRESCDYMILGQHYVQSGMGIVSTKDNPEYPLIYAKMVCEAMETGIYDIFAHPDYFMLNRDSCTSDESYALFMENAKTASLMICQKALEMCIPLELNVRGAKEYEVGRDGEFAYPHSLFWDIASEVGNEVIYAVDAHYPGHIMSIDEDREFVESKIDTSKLKFVSNDYDPVHAREENLTLQNAYEETKENSVCHETSMVQMLISRAEVGEGDDAFERIGDVLSASRTKFVADSSERIRAVDEKLAAIEDNSSYSEEKKQALREKYSLRKQRIIETCEARERAVDRAQMSLSEAREIGCETKDEYVQVVGYLTESKVSDDPVKRENATSSIDAFRESKSDAKTESIGEKPKTYVYTAPTDNNGSSSSASGSGSESSDGGFSSSMNLILVIGMLVLFGIVVSFMIR